MPENRWPVRVAVNVMRSRLTVIGFNIAVVSFQIAQLYRLWGGVKVPGVDFEIHVAADMSLWMALALSLIALMAFIMSCAFDEVGYCTHWTLIAGDMLMYLGLAHTAAGFFPPWRAALEILALKLPEHATEISILHAGLLVAGGAAWFIATYLGPAVSLVRSPFSRRSNIILGIAYLVVLLVLSWIDFIAGRVEVTSTRADPGLVLGVLRELIQPLRW